MMRLAMLASASAMVFVFAIGSVSAADQFSTLQGVKAVPMSAAELSAVKGMDHHFSINLPTDANPKIALNGRLDPPASDSSAPQTEDPGDSLGRFETSHHQDAGDENGFIQLGTRMVPPSYLGLGKASCNTVIIMPGFADCF